MSVFNGPIEWLIFGGAYLWREISVSKSIGLALQLEGNLPFLLCFTLYLRAISKYKTSGAYIWRGVYMEGLSEFYGTLNLFYYFSFLFYATPSNVNGTAK